MQRRGHLTHRQAALAAKPAKRRREGGRGRHKIGTRSCRVTGPGRHHRTRRAATVFCVCSRLGRSTGLLDIAGNTLSVAWSGL
jgi:hypothetical protein